MSASAVQLGFLDDFFGSEGPSFHQRFLSHSSPCRVKISASAVERVFEDDFWDSRDSIFIKGLSVRSSLFAQKMSASAENWASWMIFLDPGS